MAASVLMRAARRQGQQGLLAWRAALAEGHSAPQLQLEEQQGLPGLPWGAAAGAGVVAPQFFLAAQLLHCAAAPGCSALAAGRATAAGGLPPASPWLAAAPAAALGAASEPWMRQQRRGMALNFVRFQKRRRAPQEDRTLPERNEEIKAKEVRVRFVDPEQPSEVMPTKQAIKLARQQQLDVVMVSPRADPPVVRITEWSKVIYEAQKKEKAAAKQVLAQRRAADPKEVRFSCQIGEHDLGVKMAQARKFLEEGNLLRLVVLFKGGPQIALGHEVTLYLIGQLSDLARVKDEKHLQRPQRGQWAVMLEPLPPEKPSKKKDKPATAASAAVPAAGEAEQQEQGAAEAGDDGGKEAPLAAPAQQAAGAAASSQ